MQVLIIAVGKLREAYLREGISVYLTRLSPRHRVSVIEVPEGRVPESGSARDLERVREEEGVHLLDAAARCGIVVTLDPGGGQVTSEGLASLMARWELAGRGSVAFLIGSSLGLSPSLLDRADLQLSLSPMTFPHQLVRLILIEQIYRADCINRGIPYHK